MNTLVRIGIVLVFFSFSFWGGCSCGNDVARGATGVSNPPSIPINSQIFYNAAVEVTPVFAASEDAPASSQMAALTTSWTSGNPLYELFYFLQEFDPETDGGTIDVTNLYNMTFVSRGFYTDTKAACTPIPEQEITPPFDFGSDSPLPYNCAFNRTNSEGEGLGGALMEWVEDDAGNQFPVVIDDDSRANDTYPIKQVLFGFTSIDPSDPSHTEYGEMRGHYDGTNGDLSVEIALWDDETAQSDFCFRHDVDGNAGTHFFTVRSIKISNVDLGHYISLVGLGYSQGDGNYFLFKILTDDMAAELGGPRYFCIPVGSVEAELQAMNASNPSGSETVDANCEALQEGVDAMTMFPTTDLACESADFNPGGTAPAIEGTIFLNFSE